MASRMERYYGTSERSKKNAKLYEEISNLGNYSNIEAVADISNSNEINISKIKEMLRAREIEEEKSTKIQPSENINIENKKKKVKKEPKNYDLHEILNKAKIEHNDTDAKYRKLNKSEYEFLKKIKLEESSDEEINELLNTISVGNNNEDDLGIFDELKSNTMVGDASSIKKIIEEAKEEDIEDTIETEEETKGNLDNIDRSFYTSSFTFSDKDFEDLRSLDHSLKANNKLIRILIIIFSCLVAVGVLILVMNLIF